MVVPDEQKSNGGFVVGRDPVSSLQTVISIVDSILDKQAQEAGHYTHGRTTYDSVLKEAGYTTRVRILTGSSVFRVDSCRVKTLGATQCPIPL